MLVPARILNSQYFRKPQRPSRQRCSYPSQLLLARSRSVRLSAAPGHSALLKLPAPRARDVPRGSSPRLFTSRLISDHD